MTVFTGDSGNNTLNGDVTDDLMFGLGGNDTINGNGGNDYIVGGTGSDKMFGGSGNDTFQIGVGETAAGETYSGGSGTDTLLVTTLSPSAPTGVTADFRNSTVSSIEDLMFAGAGRHSAYFNADIVGTGLSATLHVDGGAGANDIALDMMTKTSLDLSGWTFSNWSGTTAIYGTIGNDTITGTSGNDFISAEEGHDIVHGGGGNDMLDAGLSQAGEVYDGGAGTDTIYSGAAMTDLTVMTVQSIEGYTFGGYGFGDYHTMMVNASQFGGGGISTALNIDGSFGDHNSIDIIMGDQTYFSAGQFTFAKPGLPVSFVFVGDADAETMVGSSASDLLGGDAGDDTLLGGGGNDTLNGGLGADVMNGGSGDDTYFVDNAGDQVSETFFAVDEGGHDLVHSSVSFTLGAYLEDLTLHGGDLSGTGNALANVITGTDGNNLLKGLGGNDTLIGGKGIDVLYGGAGADTFVFTSGADSQPYAGLRDKIMDFKSGLDHIDVSKIDADPFTPGDQAFTLDSDGTLATGEYSVSVSAAGNMMISFNLDGGSAPDMQIVLMNVPSLQAGDLIL